MDSSDADRDTSAQLEGQIPSSTLTDYYNVAWTPSYISSFMRVPEARVLLSKVGVARWSLAEGEFVPKSFLDSPVRNGEDKSNGNEDGEKSVGTDSSSSSSSSGSDNSSDSDDEVDNGEKKTSTLLRRRQRHENDSAAPAAAGDGDGDGGVRLKNSSQVDSLSDNMARKRAKFMTGAHGLDEDASSCRAAPHIQHHPSSVKYFPNNFFSDVRWSPDGLCLLTNSESTHVRIYEVSPQYLSYIACTPSDSALTTSSPPLISTTTSSSSSSSTFSSSSSEPSLNDWTRAMRVAVDVSEGAPVYDMQWHPLMHSNDPASCLFATGGKGFPVRIRDAFNGDVMVCRRVILHCYACLAHDLFLLLILAI